jgi:hypothetical protein
MAAVMAVSTLAGTAVAQPGGGGGGRGGNGMMRAWLPDAISSRAFEEYVKALGLSDDQSVAAHALFDGYSTQARSASDKFRRKMEDIRQKAQDSGDWSVMGELRPIGKQLRDDRKKMDEQFVSDVKELLSADQAAKWPEIEKSIRREQTLGRGFVPGERVDLVQVSRKLGGDVQTAEALKPMIALYVDELDAELVKRNQMSDAMADKMASGKDFDPALMQEAMVKGREFGIRIRDINRKYARQMADSLPDADRVAFNDAVKRESYPDVFRATQSIKAMDAASGFKDLQPEQKEKLAALKTSFERDLAAINEKSIAAIEEATKNFDPARPWGGGGGGGGRGGPMGELRRERRDFDRTAVESLKKILTTEQIERLPAPDPEEQNGGPGGGRRFRADT